ncbi:hypothetical protein, variant 2 [Fonticula alba]|nr:hypothetical protein, variant 2 [Fonticula alba]KCV68727.1 hypothetical protein, variant 2 [Fonticula alba]|eukprot:XP_009497159.1 hypothetical protein, variant 2 [Fonticula alba]
MVLNTFGIDPGRKWKGNWRWFSEEMLDCCAPRSRILESGITFSEFACLAQCNGLHAESHLAEQSSYEEFLSAIKRACSSEDTVCVISYSRATLQQTGDGHFSPIGAYDPIENKALVLDVARFKYPSYWVPVDLLWESLRPCDSVTGRSRGYFLLSRSSLKSGSVETLDRLGLKLSESWPAIAATLRDVRFQLEQQALEEAGASSGTPLPEHSPVLSPCNLSAPGTAAAAAVVAATATQAGAAAAAAAAAAEAEVLALRRALELVTASVLAVLPRMAPVRLPPAALATEPTPLELDAMAHPLYPMVASLVQAHSLDVLFPPGSNGGGAGASPDMSPPLDVATLTPCRLAAAQSLISAPHLLALLLAVPNWLYPRILVRVFESSLPLAVVADPATATACQDAAAAAPRLTALLDEIGHLRNHIASFEVLNECGCKCPSTKTGNVPVASKRLSDQ